MTRIAMLILALGSWAGPQAPSTGRAADEAAIRKEIESIFAAFIDKDREKLAATHGENWRGYQSWSRSLIKGRDGYMRETVGDGPMGPKGQGMVGYRILEYDTVWYGETAVVNFVADVQYRDGTREWTSKLTLMDIYAKEDGRWMQVASQTSLHPEAQERRLSELQPLEGEQRASLLAAREAVWRAWYGGDTAALAKLVPPELVTLGPGAEGWGTHDAIVAASAEFAKSGGKLVRLVFPRTEIQAYGNTAIIYTSYELDISSGGKTRTERGKATEIFVRRDGRWLNTGWQLAPETSGS
jgi:ketosteroid isomerase-like protein